MNLLKRLFKDFVTGFLNGCPIEPIPETADEARERRKSKTITNINDALWHVKISSATSNYTYVPKPIDKNVIEELEKRGFKVEKVIHPLVTNDLYYIKW